MTAELRSSLLLTSTAETSAIPSLETFEKVLPLPVWRDIVQGDVRYRCPVARLLAAQNHLDVNFLASQWQALLLSSREKVRGDSAGTQPLKSSDGIYSPISAGVAWGEETQLEQEGSLLSWTLGERGLRRWLAVSASSFAFESNWAAEYSSIYGVRRGSKQRTAVREFNWHCSFVRSKRLLRLLTETKGKVGAIPLSVAGAESDIPFVEQGIQPSSGLDRPGFLPLVLAQMSLVDAMAVAPQHVVSAADQLSHAWVNWSSLQVLNDLRLSQMAENLPFEAVACLTSSLLGRSIQGVFGVNPVEEF